MPASSSVPKQDGLPAADLAGHVAHRDVAETMAPAVAIGQAGVGLCQRHVPMMRPDVDGEPCGDAVIADEPQGDGGQQEAEAPLDGLGQGLMAVVRRPAPGCHSGCASSQRLILRHQLRLVRRQQQNDGKGGQHDARPRWRTAAGS